MFMRLIINLEEMADAFGTFVVLDGRRGGRVRGRVKAREYLGTLGYSALFMERERTLKLINQGHDFIAGSEFPDIQNPRLRYTMRLSEYLGLVNKKLVLFEDN